MNLVDRIKGILVEPRNEWPKIAAEPATVQSLYTGWIMILAAIGPIAVRMFLRNSSVTTMSTTSSIPRVSKNCLSVAQIQVERS